MYSIFIRRSILLLFTIGFSVGSYMAVQRYLHNNKPTVYPAVSTVQIQKQSVAANGQIQKLQSSLTEATKAKTAIDKQYSNLMVQKNTLTKKEQAAQSIHHN